MEKEVQSYLSQCPGLHPLQEAFLEKLHHTTGITCYFNNISELTSLPTVLVDIIIGYLDFRVVKGELPIPIYAGRYSSAKRRLSYTTLDDKRHGPYLTFINKRINSS